MPTHRRTSSADTRLLYRLVNPAQSGGNTPLSAEAVSQRRGNVVRELSCLRVTAHLNLTPPCLYIHPTVPPTGPTGAPIIKTQVVPAESHSKDSEESRVGIMAGRDHGPDIAGDTVSDAGPSVASSSTVTTAIPDERAVWISQRLRIRSTQNLVDVDLEADGTPQTSGGGGGFGAAVPDAGPAHLVQPTEPEENIPKACQRHRTRIVRDASSSSTSAARHEQKKKQHGHSPLIRTGTQAAPGPRRTKSKVRMKAFDIRVEEYKEERRHVSQGGSHE